MLVFLLALGAALVRGAQPPFENTAITRVVELGGSLSHVTTTFAVKALEDDVKSYVVSLSAAEGAKTIWASAKLKGSKSELEIARERYDDESDVYFYEIKLPRALHADETETIVLETELAHASSPWPEYAPQTAPNRLRFEGDMLILSPYRTAIQRTKLKSTSPSVQSYSDPKPPSAFVQDAQVTKSGSTVTYGPFVNVPPSMNVEFQREHQRRVHVQYDLDGPSLTAITLDREAEISHWGSNLNVQDRVHLLNTGPKLKGHFSRVEQQRAMQMGHALPTTIWWLVIQLPAGIRNPYYFDANGNVSTSHIRIAPSLPRSESPLFNPSSIQGLTGKALSSKFSALEFRPRYPILGGWNYTFSIGWDAPLSDYAVREKNGRYIVGVPFLNTLMDVAVDDASLTIIMPEGATNVHLATPFPMDSIEPFTHITYLDTIGRPALKLFKRGACEKHESIVYVSYELPLSAHLRKPFAVGVAMFSIFLVAIAFRRVNFRIHTPPTPGKKD